MLILDIVLTLLMAILAITICNYFDCFNNDDLEIKENDITVVASTNILVQNTEIDNITNEVYTNNLIAQKITIENVEEEEVFFPLNTDAIKIDVYESNQFQNFDNKLIYKNIIIKKLWINEPFHTTFTKILLFIDKNNFWIQSPNTKKLKLKVRNVDNSFSKGVSFKVVSLINTLKFTLVSVSEFYQNKFYKKDIQIIIIVTIFYVLQQSKNVNELYNQDNLIDYFLVNYDKHTILNILNLIESSNTIFCKIKEIYTTKLEQQIVHPYVHKTESKVLDKSTLIVNISQKKLISIDRY